MGAAPVMRYAVDTAVVLDQFVPHETKRMVSNLLLSSNKVLEFNADAWGREQVIALRDSLGVAKFGYAGRLLADALSNLANLTWHPAKVQNVKDAQMLVKELHNIRASEFESAYLEVIRIQREISARSFNVFSTTRPNPPEIKGLMTPQQVRLWKRWSAILQGTSKVNP
jgi:hypothetical protein